jgi:hypothetical protein
MNTDLTLTDDQVCAIILARDPFQSPPTDPFEFDVDLEWPDPPVTVNQWNLRRLFAKVVAPSASEAAAAFDAIISSESTTDQNLRCPPQASAERARAWLAEARNDEGRGQ